MPAEGLKWLKRDDILRFEEITRLARVFVERYGVRTIRITGGEPLVRIKVEELIGMINDLDPTLDITMTTNGVLLRDKAHLLKKAGLKRINISLDTLNMERFHEIARSDQFSRTMDGIRAAREAGLWPIKLNMVVMKGHNDDEVVDFARLARDEGYEVRSSSSCHWTAMAPGPTSRSCRAGASRSRSRISSRWCPSPTQGPGPPRDSSSRTAHRAGSASSRRSARRSAPRATESASPPRAVCARASSLSRRRRCATSCARGYPTITSAA
jgi:cyclic pyranopterin phosphate synthase